MLQQISSLSISAYYLKNTNSNKIGENKILNYLTYFESINEKDRGQETNNPHLIARRHLTSGNPTNSHIINLVQSHLGNTITQEEVDNLTYIQPITIDF